MFFRHQYSQIITFHVSFRILQPILPLGTCLLKCHSAGERMTNDVVPIRISEISPPLS